jgi:hypothetical protein
MKKFAYAAIAALCVGASTMLITTPLDAKGGGGGGGHSAGGRGVHVSRGYARNYARLNIGPLARPAKTTVHNIGPLSGRYAYLASKQYGHHNHGHRNNQNNYWDYGSWGYWGGGYDSSYTPPIVIQTSDTASMYDSYAAPSAQPVIRKVAETSGGCSTQEVKVPASGGGETTINVIRC